MLRILFYTDTPHFGGAEKQIHLLAKHLKKRGYSVSLAYGRYSQIGAHQNEFQGYYDKIFVINTCHKHDPRHYWRFKKILKENTFDLIHLHLWNPGACRYAFWAAGSIPIVTTEHDPFELSGIKRWIKNKCLQKTAHTIAISEENKRLMMEVYGLTKDQVTVVHNGIEAAPFLDNQKKADLSLQPNDIVITCIAELHPRKGHKYLLEAFLKLQKIMPHLQLMLVGTGPSENELKKQYGGHQAIHFLGWRKDIPEILKASDILVLPSLNEAFGLVILEAMASGVAVIGTDSGGVKDIIENGKTGYLVPPGNSEEIAKTIEIILENPDQKRDIEKAARLRVQQAFTAENMTEGAVEVYQKIISPSSASRNNASPFPSPS